MSTPSQSIQSIEVGGDTFKNRWGVLGCEYKVVDSTGSATQTDFQDLMIYITEKRATAIESQVTPMETRIRTRNQNLEYLGTALSAVTAALDNIDTSEDVDKQKTTISSWSDDAQAGIALTANSTYIDKAKKTNESWTKSQLDELSQLLKTKTDRLNNDSSEDSTRLEGLVDRRDEAFSTASTLMTNISDTRSNLIKNV